MKEFHFYIPTKILFGAGRISELHRESLPGKKALIVTSAGKSIQKFGYLDKLTQQLDMSNICYIIFDKALANPILAHVQEGAQIAKKEGCDFVIGLGGGSSIDTAKFIAVLTTNEGNYWDYMTEGSGKHKPVTVPPLPIVAITTTAGTGTEMNPWTVITNRDLNEKVCFGLDKPFPALAIVDPELMVSVPSQFTAYQGFDALFYSTECYISTAASQFSDMLSLKAIESIGRNLEQAVNDGKDLEARAYIALGNTLSGMSDSTSSGICCHSLAHAMGALNPNMPHGAAIIMICEEYYRVYIEQNACNEKMVNMARPWVKRMQQNPPTLYIL